MNDETPFEYHDKKLGVKIKFLISDSQENKTSRIIAHEKSLKFITYRSLRNRIQSNTQSEKELRKASWSYEALVLFSSLSVEWINKLTHEFGNPKEETKKSWFAQNYVSDRKAFDFFFAYTFGEDGKKLEATYVEQYTYNASVLNTVLLMKNNRKQYLKALGCTSVDIWDSLSRDVNSFREVPHNLPTTRNSLQRKASEYAKNGYIEIISGKHITKNAAKVKDEEQFALIDELLAKHTNLDNELISNLYNMVAERLNWKTITAQTVANRKTDSNLVVFAGRNGASALSNKILMQNKRMKPSAPMLYWSMDGWDAELLYQKTDIDKRGYSTTTYHNRLTIIVVLDPFNKYPVGYAIGLRENPELIKEALRNAVNHTSELFGMRYKPYQLQADRYQYKALKPFYEACTKFFTPSKAHNSKSKVIEPYWNHINKTYCRLFDNWSGFNVDSGSDNQPNSEYLNKIRHTFPDQKGVIMQLESIIQQERSKKLQEYLNNWENVSAEYRQPMEQENYLMTMGATSGTTNKLEANGLNVTIQGQKMTYDCFDINFRKQAHQNWSIMYDTHDLSTVLAVSSDTKYRFLLEQKHIQAMAIADRKENDSFELQKVKDFNKDVENFISGERENNFNILENLFNLPQLNDTLAKHLLVDSRGQHKDQKSKERLENSGQNLIERQELKEAKKQDSNWRTEHNDYVNQKIDINEYLR